MVEENIIIDASPFNESRLRRTYNCTYYSFNPACEYLTDQLIKGIPTGNRLKILDHSSSTFWY